MALFCLAAGVPEFGADLDNVKPAGLIVAAAVAMLAVGLPLSGGKTFGNVHTQLPSLTADALAMVRLHSCPHASLLHGLSWVHAWSFQYHCSMHAAPPKCRTSESPRYP